MNVWCYCGCDNCRQCNLMAQISPAGLQLLGSFCLNIYIFSLHPQRMYGEPTFTNYREKLMQLMTMRKTF
ncbi:unnamed protein product [Ixodes persulcatus]